MTPRAGGWVEAERLRRAVKDAGFKPGEVQYAVTGTLIERGGQPALRLEGSDRILILQPEPGKSEPYERAQRAAPETPSKTADVEGPLVERSIAADRTTPAALRVQRLEVHEQQSGGDVVDQP